MFNDRPEVRAVIQYFSMGDSVEGWVKAGGAISPHKDSSLDWYTNDPVDRGVAEIIQNATVVPLRCLRPDAGRGWRWFLLEDDDRLCQLAPSTWILPSKKSTPPGRSK